MRKLFLIAFLLSSFYLGFNQQIELQGQYNGENLYILNSTDKEGEFCVNGISVNGGKTNDEFNSSSFEIDLSQLDLGIGTPLKVILSHKPGCIPKVINPEAIKLQNNFTYKSLTISRKGILTWAIAGDAGDEPFEIQQFRWKKWIVVGEVDLSDSVTLNKYFFEVPAHYGQNLFRICQTDKHGNIFCSAEKKYRTIVSEILLLSDKVGDELEFSSETFYEIYSEDGEFLKSGNESEVDVSELSKGNYWVHYDNKTEKFLKK